MVKLLVKLWNILCRLNSREEGEWSPSSPYPPPIVKDALANCYTNNIRLESIVNNILLICNPTILTVIIKHSLCNYYFKKIYINTFTSMRENTEAFC